MFAAIAVLALLSGQACSLFESVTHIRSSTGVSKLVNSEQPLPALVAFYDPSCPHCRSLSSPFARAASRANGLATFSAVDCSAHAHLCSGIQGVPTLSLYPPEAGSSPIAYSKGDRSESSLFSFAVSNLPSSRVTPITTADEHSSLVLAQSNHPRVVVLSKKRTASPMLRALATRFRKSISFFLASPSLSSTYNATSLPAVFVLPANSNSVSDNAAQFNEPEVNANSLANWLTSFTHDPLATGINSDPSSSASSPSIQTLQSSESVLASTNAAIVSFAHTNDPDCEQSLNELAQSLASVESSSVASVYQVNASCPSASTLASAFNASLPEKSDRGCARLFAKPLRPNETPVSIDLRGGGAITQSRSSVPSSKRLSNAVFDLAPEECIESLSDEIQASNWLETAKPGQVSIALMTEKEEPPALFRHLGCTFVGMPKDDEDDDEAEEEGESESETPDLYRFAMIPVQGAKQFMQRLGNPRPPAVFAFMRFVDGSSSDSKLAMSQHQGKLTFDGLKQFVEAAARQMGSGSESSRGPAQPSGSTALLSVANADDFKRACSSMSALCVLGLLDQRKQAFAQHKQALSQGASRAAAGDQALSLVVVDDAHIQPHLLQALNLGEADLPFVVVLSRARSIAMKMKGAYSEGSIKELIESIIAGKGIGYSTEHVQVEQLANSIVTGGEDDAHTGYDGVDEPPLDEILAEDIQGSEGAQAKPDDEL